MFVRVRTSVCALVCTCVCLHGRLAEPCASKEQVWGGSPALPVAHLRGRLCAACALSLPTPHRAGEPGGERGVRRGERGLKGINHGREKRAGGRRDGGGWLAAHGYPLLSPSALFLLSFICAYADELRCTGRGGQGGRTRRHRGRNTKNKGEPCLLSG